MDDFHVGGAVALEIAARHRAQRRIGFVRGDTRGWILMFEKQTRRADVRAAVEDARRRGRRTEFERSLNEDVVKLRTERQQIRVLDLVLEHADVSGRMPRD